MCVLVILMIFDIMGNLMGGVQHKEEEEDDEVRFLSCSTDLNNIVLLITIYLVLIVGC